MSVNRYQSHVLVLPEDDANRQMANGFVLSLDWPVIRRIQVLAGVGGWNEVLNRFQSDHVAEMERLANRFMVLLIDFDDDPDRLKEAKNRIPETLTDRVFILGTWSEPEALKRAGLGSYEEIGSALAQDCREQTTQTWDHNLLRHNANELTRLRDHVRPILF